MNNVKDINDLNDINNMNGMNNMKLDMLFIIHHIRTISYSN